MYMGEGVRPCSKGMVTYAEFELSAILCGRQETMCLLSRASLGRE